PIRAPTTCAVTKGILLSRPRKIARSASLNGSLRPLIWALSADFAGFGCVGGRKSWRRTESEHGLRRASQKLGDTYQVVGGRGEGEHPAHPGGAAMTGLAQPGDGLDPAEHLLDALANAPADGITGVSRGATVDGG